MYSTFSSTPPPSSSIGMDKRYCFRRIKAIEILNLPPEWDKRSYYLKMFAGNVYEKTKTYKVKKKDRGTTSTPRWTLDLDLRDVGESETFEVEIYCRQDKGEYRVLGCSEAVMRDILIGEDDTIIIPIRGKLSCANTSLKIFRDNATDYPPITQSACEDQDMSAASQSSPSNSIDPRTQTASDLSGLQPEATSVRSVENDWAAAGKVVEDTVEPNEPSEWISKFIDGIDTLHPAASIALDIVFACVNILKQQTERDKTILQLYEAMIMTYKDASNNRELWQRKQLEPSYIALFQITNECGMFIRGYAKKNRIKRFFSLDVKQKAEEFIQGFTNLRKQLGSDVAKDGLVVTLGVGAKVDTLAMQPLLQDLKPGQELGPKSLCMTGTRTETINSLVSWIANCDNSVLWCSGLAGTGKSSLVGTLHDLLSFHMGSRSRLAAFIRYDRTLYRNSSELITSIAYSLGMFDQRIGEAIAKALRTSRATVKMAPSQSSTQLQLLVQKPLATIPELQNEGPLIVIIDGLDESDVSQELLEVLADGFGSTLPFMRLIVSSRPTEKISRVFKNCQHVHRYQLDTSSDEVKQDIQYFIQQRFASIEDESVWGTHNKEDVITQLAERASGLFIWAAIVCLFLRCNVGPDKSISHRARGRRVGSIWKEGRCPTMHLCSIRRPDCSQGQHDGAYACRACSARRRPFSEAHRCEIRKCGTREIWEPGTSTQII
ncbi:hypothetical protein ARMGADRAFT_351055 [Armillaria gallica]|uniref:Nephrocystin 3-like N-terminal domain-containing protein n=1 Tax=Armillaria gallica TaxID=47427 RepID=A0A2H3D4P2_ARMGA|nr:hypothetical protein ARMGADRAFT_351055 [Armillaria gallica]